MRRYINGQEIELDANTAEVFRLSDRLAVRSADGAHTAVALRSGDKVLISYRGRVHSVESARVRTKSTGSSNGELRAPMPGQIVDVVVSQGQAVKMGDKLLVLEAMKTQQPFIAPFDGVVSQLIAKVGDQVVDGAVLVVITASEPKS